MAVLSKYAHFANSHAALIDELSPKLASICSKGQFSEDMQHVRKHVFQNVASYFPGLPERVFTTLDRMNVGGLLNALCAISIQFPEHVGSIALTDKAPGLCIANSVMIDRGTSTVIDDHIAYLSITCNVAEEDLCKTWLISTLIVAMARLSFENVNNALKHYGLIYRDIVIDLTWSPVSNFTRMVRSLISAIHRGEDVIQILSLWRERKIDPIKCEHKAIKYVNGVPLIC